MKYEEITNCLTEKAISELKKGQILMFREESGKRNDLKVTRIDRKNKRIWAKLIKTFSEDEISVTGKKNILGKRKSKTLREYNESSK